MADDPAAFEDLPHVGPAIAGRLRQLGVHTFDDLAAADPERLRLDLGVKGLSPERVNEWVAAARDARPPGPDRSPAAGGAPARPADQPPERPTDVAGHPGLPDGEPAGLRRESFVLTLTVDDAGTVVRSAAAHVRSKAEAGWPGWSSTGVAEFAAFVAEHAGLAGPVLLPPTSGPPPTRAGSQPPTSGPRPAPAGASVPTSLPAAVATGGAGAEATIDAGLAYGGPRALREYVVAYDGPPAGDGAGARVTYKATLLLRELGTADQRVVGQAYGEADGDLVLRFPGGDVPPGVYRAALDVHVSPAPAAGAPRLRLLVGA
jgi:hypothetical protein